MPKKKAEIKKQYKKKVAKEGAEHQELNQQADIVDLGDNRGDDIVVETFDDIKTKAKPLPFSTKPQDEHPGFFRKVKYTFSQDRLIVSNNLCFLGMVFRIQDVMLNTFFS